MRASSLHGHRIHVVISEDIAISKLPRTIITIIVILSNVFESPTPIVVCDLYIDFMVSIYLSLVCGGVDS